MQTTKDRIRLFLEYKGISQSAFERTCGFSHGYVSNMRRAPSDSACSLIVRHYPELNVSWLKTGMGEMLTSEALPGPVDESERTRYQEMIEHRDRRIKELESRLLELQRKLDNLQNCIPCV